VPANPTAAEDLFGPPAESEAPAGPRPLADRLRPRSLVEVVGQDHLLGPDGTLKGATPLAKLVLAKPDDQLRSLTQEPLIFCHAGAREKEVAELFDKYNLMTLPVIDDAGKLTGVITSDDVISLLRAKL